MSEEALTPPAPEAAQSEETSGPPPRDAAQVFAEAEEMLEDAEIFADAVASFAAIDLNGDGAISIDEFRDHLRTCEWSLETISAVFGALDVNKDGVLGLEELAEGFARYASLRRAPGLGWSNDEMTEAEDAAVAAVFAEIDADESGEVSMQECSTHLQGKRGFSPEAVEFIFEAIDLNMDGSISVEEFRDACQRYTALRLAFGLPVTPSSETILLE